MFTRKPASEVETRVSSSLQQPRIPALLTEPAHGASAPKQDSSDPTREEGWVVIGKGTRVQGKIGDCKRLDVHGVLEADVVADLLVVREGGGIKGTVQSDNAKIRGVFEGTLIVHDHLEIESTGHVTGDVSYRTLAIQAGARLRGNVVCSEQDVEAQEPQQAAGNVISIPGMFNHDHGEQEGYANGYATGHETGRATGYVNGTSSDGGYGRAT